MYVLDNPTKLAKTVRNELASLAQVNAPSVRQITKTYSRALRTTPPQVVLRFVYSLLLGAKWSERVIAWEVLASHRAAFQLLNDRHIEKMAKGLDDWASVDLFGVTILGQAWRSGLVSDEKILSWTRSRDRWRRRLVLVGTVPLNSKARGGKGDVIRTLRVCRTLVDDRDDMVVKAMSWALRELAKREPAAVRAFIEEEGERLASRVKREVWNKLTTGRKSLKVQ